MDPRVRRIIRRRIWPVQPENKLTPCWALCVFVIIFIFIFLFLYSEQRTRYAANFDRPRPRFSLQPVIHPETADKL